MPFALRSYEEHRLKKIARLCQGKSLLDIGYAHIPNPYYSHIHRVGLDLEKPKVPSSYEEELLGDACELMRIFPDRRFDTVVAGEIVEHMEDPLSFLRGIRTVLSPNGRLILSTPNPLSWPVIFFEWARSRRFFYTPYHIYYFTPRWMERLLHRAGFEMEKVEGVGLWTPIHPLPCPIALSYQVIYVARAATSSP